MILASMVLGAAMLAPPAPVAADTACPLHPTYPVPGRPSPLDSLTFSVAGKTVKICYGRPAARGRKIFGGNVVPFGQLWRTGANEPTVFFTPIDLTIAGLAVPAGKYSLYTVPGETEWEIVINRATLPSGHTMWYTDEVKAQELGRAKVKSEPFTEMRDVFTITPDPARGDATALVLEWEKTRVRIPIAAR
jgi:hypothetical protein